MVVNPDQPHWYARRPSIVQAFNLDAPRPCKWCGGEPWLAIHGACEVRAFERANPEANTGRKRNS